MNNAAMDLFYARNDPYSVLTHSVNTPLYHSALFNDEKNMHIDPIYKLLAQQNTLEQFHQNLHSCIEDMGFSLFQISHLEREKAADRNDKDWPESTQRALDINSPTLSRNHQQKDPAFRISAVKSAITHMDAGNARTYKGELVDVFGSMDFHDTYSLSTPAFIGQGFLILTVMAKGLNEEDFYRLIQQHKRPLLTLIDAINTIGGIKFPSFLFNKRASLEPPALKKPMQALQWASLGYAHKQIADKMNISYKTVNDHLRSAREILRAKSTGHAIRIAIEQGLLN
jgi:DNA-binding CsgD family transcriptional regulator